MSSKADKIKEMLEMQKKFMTKEHESGVSQQEYYTPEAGSVLDGYRQKYRDLAMEVMDIAHKEKGSER
jgi:hypothetical protein